jgi:hypothetical protein
MRVDLPEPDGPMIAVSWPRRMSTEMSSSAGDRGGASALGLSHANRKSRQAPDRSLAGGHDDS